ncbi:MAG: hypothetical protein AAF098_16170 [Pseudomonadota bacterium]
MLVLFGAFCARFGLTTGLCFLVAGNRSMSQMGSGDEASMNRPDECVALLVLTRRQLAHRHAAQAVPR